MFSLRVIFPDLDVVLMREMRANVALHQFCPQTKTCATWKRERWRDGEGERRLPSTGVHRCLLPLKTKTKTNNSPWSVYSVSADKSSPFSLSGSACLQSTRHPKLRKSDYVKRRRPFSMISCLCLLFKKKNIIIINGTYCSGVYAHPSSADDPSGSGSRRVSSSAAMEMMIEDEEDEDDEDESCFFFSLSPTPRLLSRRPRRRQCPSARRLSPAVVDV